MVISMRIVYLINESTNASVEHDSGIFIAVELDKAILDHEIIFLGSKALSNFFKNFITLGDSYFNKYQIRFDFPYRKMREIMGKLNPDIMFINQIEQASNFRIVFNDLGLNPYMISFSHYIPIYMIRDNNIIWDPSLNVNGSAEIIFLRHVEAVRTSSLIIHPSEFSRDLFVKAMDLTLRDYSHENKFVVMYPPLNLDLINKINNDQYEPENLVIIYNHRLYDHYGTKQVINILDQYYMTLDSDERKRFKVIVTGPGLANRTPEQNRHDPSPQKNIELFKRRSYVIPKLNMPKFEYYQLISREVTAGLAPIRPNAVWSISLAEVMAFGKPVVAPNLAVFPEMKKFGDVYIYDVSYDFDSGLKVDVNYPQLFDYFDKIWDHRPSKNSKIESLCVKRFVDSLLKLWEVNLN